MSENIAVIGLGLIGGSLCKAFRKFTKHTIFAFDVNNDSMQSALELGEIDGIANAENLAKCDYVILAVFPQASMDFVVNNVTNFKKGSVVTDCVGVKENLCNKLVPLCREHDVHFIGGHPMAGIEKSGFEFSFADLFIGASMILCPDEQADFMRLKGTEYLFSQIGFRKILVTTAEKHDKMIALTSQLAHVISSAYIKSPSALEHRGFSAGSFRDLTRVAYLNENMWTELFFENKTHLLNEVDGLIDRISEYRDALKNDDRELMKKLLADGKHAKIISAE